MDLISNTAPDGSYRITMDFRALNSRIVKYDFPLPNISDLLGRLAGGSVFSKLDLTDGFHQVPISVT